MPKGKDGRRTTARAKGKVGRPFLTIKELHETLYRFHKPKDEEEANQWLINFVLRENEREHRIEPHSRIEDWSQNIPPSGIREMCEWERYCTLARELERRKVGSDATINVDGGKYLLNPELAGETVILWWGLFDTELYVESNGKRYGPSHPVGGPIPLHRYRMLKKTKAEKRADAIETLAREISLSKKALTSDTVNIVSPDPEVAASKPRRKFSAKYKLRILHEVDKLHASGSNRRLAAARRALFLAFDLMAQTKEARTIRGLIAEKKRP